VKFLYSRWFSLVEFFIVGICCLALSFFAEWGWWPLIVAFSPWILRFIKQDPKIQRTPYDLLIMVFIISALVGLWAAYNQDRAFHKILLLIGAILLFYSLTRQSFDNLWLVILILGFWGVLTNIIFLLITDWMIYSPDLGLVEQIGKWLTNIRPNLNFTSRLDTHRFHPNIVGGINAVLMPLCTASTIHFWGKKNKYLTVISVCILLFIGFGLVLTSSRAAWVATACGFVLFTALNISVFSRFLTRKQILVFLPLLITALGLSTPTVLAEFFAETTKPITELTSFSSRIIIAKDTILLIADFPFTGGGLGSFPGLYSEYMLVIPHFMFNYSHNLYLDLALEQGIVGLLLWTGIILVCGITLTSVIKTHPKKTPSQRFLATSVYASLIILLVHGIADDPFYSNLWGLPFLFLLPGFSVAISEQNQVFIIDKYYYRAAAIILVVALGVMTLFYKPIFASWYANIGSVNMSKHELADWPTGNWDTNSKSDPESKAAGYFKKAISLHNRNRTANHRLGIMMMSKHDFQNAESYLESAHKTDPKHRGIRKSLAYCYIWLGEFEKAASILTQIPEAQTEMKAYIDWWHAQGRDDLASNASQIVLILGSE